MSNKTPSIVGIKDTLEVRINPATEDAQISGNASLSAIESDVDDIRIQTDQFTFTAGGLKVDASVTGSIIDNDDGSIAAGQTGILLNLDLLQGYNGATWERIGSLSNRLLVDGRGVTQPISAVSIPLPTGASTSGAGASGGVAGVGVS